MPKEAYTIEKFTWETGKENLAPGINTYESIRMMDATPAQLNQFYNHAYEMLYNSDNGHYGREIELKKTKEQRIKCNTELFLRYIEKNNNIPRYTLLDTILETIHSDQLSHHHVSDLKIPGLNFNFMTIPLNIIIEGCMDNLGVLKNKNLTTEFIIRYGVWIREDDIITLQNRYPGINTLSAQIIKYCEWADRSPVRITPKGLTLHQIKSLQTLKGTKFNEMTDDQLTLLRNRILIDIEERLKKQITFWKRKITEIRAVADKREITLKEPSVLYEKIKNQS